MQVGQVVENTRIRQKNKSHHIGCAIVGVEFFMILVIFLMANAKTYYFLAYYDRQCLSFIKRKTTVIQLTFKKIIVRCIYGFFLHKSCLLDI